ncbi:hypothetical protein PC9H_010357 [Pleurotus ostreatus]|uniref:Uncharacterized protein n=1 Tax=Pleurotus ostreatus TaxID=5322 RepID=A0A8H7DN83_PLEOS|nr:uncharacterized protein PC9H_010357 [Pleurotus ostreatus]KAF7422202.1 hypothetical protein PC9H_010357 [Pleurotus ostreatus]KAJ8692009.1 hypothetical protein PTI98_011526 [Pleurotus ostreatus]
MSLPAARSIKDGLLQRVQTIARPSADAAPDVEVTNVEYIGSYNWLDRKLPSLIVPGSPKEWVNKRMPFTLGRDVGIVVADQNGYRVPDAVLLPLFVAVNIKSSLDAALDAPTLDAPTPDVDPSLLTSKPKPAFDWPAHDVITDRNSLRKLLRWIVAAEDAPNSDFRIDAQLAGPKTVLLCRYSTNVREMAGNGFGHNYEQACTQAAPQCEEGVGHHRIIRYVSKTEAGLAVCLVNVTITDVVVGIFLLKDMNGLKMIVRYEVDAYVPDGALPDTSPPERSWRKGPSANTPASVDDLADTLANVKLAPTTPAPSPKAALPPDKASFHSGLTVYPGGSWSTPQSAIVELTTRSQRNFETMSWTDLYTQLFVSQTPHCFVGIHRQGTFTRLVRENLRSVAMERVRRAEQPRLKALRWVLGAIQDLLVERGGSSRVSLVSEAGILGVYECENEEDVLPEEIMEYFDEE